MMWHGLTEKELKGAMRVRHENWLMKRILPTFLAFAAILFVNTLATPDSWVNWTGVTITILFGIAAFVIFRAHDKKVDETTGKLLGGKS